MNLSDNPPNGTIVYMTKECQKNFPKYAVSAVIDGQPRDRGCISVRFTSQVTPQLWAKRFWSLSPNGDSAPEIKHGETVPDHRIPDAPGPVALPITPETNRRKRNPS